MTVDEYSLSYSTRKGFSFGSIEIGDRRLATVYQTLAKPEEVSNADAGDYS